MPRSQDVHRSARSSQLGSRPRRGPSPRRMMSSKPVLITTPEKDWVFDEDTGAIHHVLDQCRVCKIWHNHYIRSRDESDSWQEACQSRSDWRCQQVLLFDNSGEHKELAVLSRQVENLRDELSGRKGSDAFLHSRLQWTENSNRLLMRERDQAKKKLNETMQELLELRQQLALEEEECGHLHRRLENAAQEPLPDVRISTTRLPSLHSPNTPQREHQR